MKKQGIEAFSNIFWRVAVLATIIINLNIRNTPLNWIMATIALSATILDFILFDLKLFSKKKK